MPVLSLLRDSQCICVTSMRGCERPLGYMKAGPVTVCTVILGDHQTWRGCPLHLEYSAAYVCGGCKVTRPKPEEAPRPEEPGWEYKG